VLASRRPRRTLGHRQPTRQCNDAEYTQRELEQLANATAEFLLHLPDDKGKHRTRTSIGPRGNPLRYLIHYVLRGEGDVAPVTREVQRRPAIATAHLGDIGIHQRPIR